MATKTGIQDLRMHLFDTLERVKSINDKNCSENEKCTLEQAATICDISTQIIDSYKVEVQALGIIAKADNHNVAKTFAQKTGLMELEEHNDNGN